MTRVALTIGLDQYLELRRRAVDRRRTLGEQVLTRVAGGPDHAHVVRCHYKGHTERLLPRWMRREPPGHSGRPRREVGDADSQRN